MDDAIRGNLESYKSVIQDRKSIVSNRIANIVSHIFNPSTMGILFVISVLFRDVSTIGEATKWLLILISINLVPLGIYAIYLLRKGKIDTIFVKTRQKRTSMYILSSVMMGISCLMLQFFGADKAILVVTATILLINVLYMCINFLWKISVHSAFTGIAVAALCMTGGALSASALILIPVVSWARIKLGYHSITQVVVGAALAVAIFIGIANWFGIV